MGEEADEQSNGDIEVGEITEEPAATGEAYTWPAIRFDVPPHRAYHFYQQFRTNPKNPNNFLKCLKWYYYYY